MGGPKSNLPGVLIRRGNLDTLGDTRDVGTQEKGLVRTQKEGSHLQAKERCLRRRETC